MTRIVLPFSISLDGFVAGPDVGSQHPMGVGGDRLHDWLLGDAPDPVDAEMAREASARVGAVVLGRRTFDVGLKFWQDTPYPAPSFVVTHQPRPALAMASASFTFVTDGIASALVQAKAAAGGCDVVVMGAETARQVLAAGLADEIVLQLAPILLGSGSRLFDGAAHNGPRFATTSVILSPTVTHITLAVSKPDRQPS